MLVGGRPKLSLGSCETTWFPGVLHALQPQAWVTLFLCQSGEVNLSKINLQVLWLHFFF